MKIKIGSAEFEVADDVAEAAVEAKGEIKIDSDVVIRTPAEDATFKTNAETAAKAVGAEIGRKEVLKGIGIDVSGQHKSDATAIDAIKGFAETFANQKLADAKIAPDKKVKELETDITTLRGTISTLTTEKDNVSGQFTSFKQSIAKVDEIKKHIPSNLVVAMDKVLKLVIADINTDFTDTGALVLKDASGNVRKDPKTLEPLSVKVGVDEWFSANPDFLKGAGGGAGAGDSGAGGGAKSLEKFTEEMKEKGVAPNSPDFNVEMTKRIKDGTLEM